MLRGRVGALLEVGTGFHPELTGRENVFLNGAILNLKRREIAAKFDEIVEFADIGPFLDTPVKRYSSGMQMRLAFSVAAHLEPEIMIIDEVLSVGDIAFQEKCLARMESAADEGRTIVFISHNLAAVRNLCDRAIMLSGGRIKTAGAVEEVIEAYVGDVLSESQRTLAERENRTGDQRLRYTDLRLEKDGALIDSPVTGETFDVVLSYDTVDGRPLSGGQLRRLDQRARRRETPAQSLLGDDGRPIRPGPAAGRDPLPRRPLPPPGRAILHRLLVRRQPADARLTASRLRADGRRGRLLRQRPRADRSPHCPRRPQLGPRLHAYEREAAQPVGRAAGAVASRSADV